MQIKPGSSWVVVFPGARDSYQVPLALHEAGMLQRLVTDFYSPLDLPVAKGISKVIPARLRSKLARRFHTDLPSSAVQSNLRYAIANLLRPRNWAAQSPILGQPAGRLAARHDSPLLAYQHVATSAFTEAQDSLKVLFQMQPHPISVRDALARDTLLPEFQDGSANELTWPPEVFGACSREPLLADFCIAASNYTRQTLVESSVDENRVTVIPYGVDSQFFTPGQPRTNDKLTLLFVGQLVRQKGVHYLLEAWRRLKLPNARLRIIGGIPAWVERLNNNSNVEILGRLDWSALRNEYRSADLLCLPSLSDGFGLVVLEAMACGTPALVTKSTGAADLIEEGRNGFVVPPADLEALTSRLKWASQNLDGLRQMRGPARACTERYTWPRFRKQLVEALRSLQVEANFSLGRDNNHNSSGP